MTLRITRSGSWKLQNSRSQPAAAASPSNLELLRDPAQASALFHHPLRLKILTALLEPDSATGVARQMNLPRQTVNYHVRELAKAGLLARAGRRRRRRLFEQCYVATARGYVLSPELLGALAADPSQVADTLSATYLLGLASKLQSDLACSLDPGAAAGKRIAALSLNTELRFTSQELQAAFAEELRQAILGLVAKNSSPSATADGTPVEGRPFRLVLACYPVLAPNANRASKLIPSLSGSTA